MKEHAGGRNVSSRLLASRLARAPKRPRDRIERCLLRPRRPHESAIRTAARGSWPCLIYHDRPAGGISSTASQSPSPRPERASLAGSRAHARPGRPLTYCRVSESRLAHSGMRADLPVGDARLQRYPCRGRCLCWPGRAAAQASCGGRREGAYGCTTVHRCVPGWLRALEGSRTRPSRVPGNLDDGCAGSGGRLRGD